MLAFPHAFPEVQSKTCPKSFGQSSWRTHGWMLDEPCFPQPYQKKKTKKNKKNKEGELQKFNVEIATLETWPCTCLENLCTLCLMKMELFRVGDQSEIAGVRLSFSRCRDVVRCREDCKCIHKGLPQSRCQGVHGLQDSDVHNTRPLSCTEVLSTP